MSKSGDIHSRQGAASCRMAYTLNNRQPVQCSIISDQPLFYMDFSVEDEDEDSALDALFDFSAIESGVSALEQRVTALSRFGKQDEDMRDTQAEFIENAIAIGASSDEIVRATPDIKFLENALRQSRLAAALLDLAASFGTILTYDPQIDGGVYDRKGGAIHINPQLCREDQILLAARELRRVWQHRNGALVNPLTFHPDQAILVNRAQIADLSVIMTRVAWELQLAGDKAPWERLEASSMADLCRAFARESFIDFRTLNNGVAQSAVFETWFLSERCRNEDKKLIQTMLADYQGYVFDAGQPAQQVTAELIGALGSMPFGKNYLAPFVSTIISDAIFTEVRDRSNANFLWFIKFERSFRETEQELQTTGDDHGQGTKSGQPHKKHTRFGDHEQKAEIIALPRGGHDDGVSAQAAGAGNGNIIQFRGRRGEG